MNEHPQVLIVDDEPDIRDLVKSLLHELDSKIKTLESGDGADAWKKISMQQFDLVVTDLNMPRLKGDSLIEGFKDLHENLRPKHVIVLSGHLSEYSSTSVVKNIRFFAKPFKSEDLLNAMKEVLFPASTNASGQKFKMDVAFINPFIDSALSVLHNTCSTDAKKEKVFLRTADQISGDISALVAMNSSRFHGSLAIAFEKQAFLSAASKMLGGDFKEITEDIQDAIGVICSQIFSNSKKILNSQGHDIAEATPSIVVGDRHKIRHLVNGPCLTVGFTTPAGKFVIEAVVSGK